MGDSFLVFWSLIISRKEQKKKSNYPKLEIGDNVRVPVINKVKKGYKDSFSMEMHKIEDVNRGLYTVDGSLHTRKDLQLVKGNIIKSTKKIFLNVSMNTR